jgi:hypothetical protein
MAAASWASHPALFRLKGNKHPIRSEKISISRTGTAYAI